MPTADTTDRRSPWNQVAGLIGRHRRLVAALAVAGMVLGGLFAALGPASYTAESRLLVGTFEAPAAAIPGYVLASQTVAGNYARLADSSTVLAKLPTDLPLSPEQIRSMVTVTAIPESAIIRVVATSGDADDARQAAEAMAAALDETVAELNAGSSGDALLAEYSTAAQELSAATTRQAEAQSTLSRAQQGNAATSRSVIDAQAELDAANLALGTAKLKVEGIATQYQTQQETVSTSSRMRLLGGAKVSEKPRALTILLDMVIGAVLGVAIGLGVAGRRERRSVDEPEAAESTA